MKTGKHFVNGMLAIVLPVCVAASFLLYRSGDVHYEAASNAKKISTEFSGIESQIVKTISDSVLVSELITDSYTFDQFEKLTDLPFGMVIYQGDSAVMWTNNSIIPVKANILYDDAPLYITEANGSYILYKHTFPDSIHTIGFLPVRFEYGISNEYLNDLRPGGIYIPKQFSISARPGAGSYAVSSSGGNPVFYIQPDNTSPFQPDFSGWLYVFITLSGIILLAFIFSLSRFISNKINKYAGITLALLLFTAFYLLIDALLQSRLFSYLPLFDPTNYASAGIASSTGDLIIKTILFFCFALFFANHFYVRLRDFKLSVINMLITFAGISLLLWGCYYMVKIFKSLVIDSAISFDIHNFFSLNYFSLAGFLCIATGLLSFFLIASRICEILFRNYKRPHIITGTIAAFAGFIVAAHFKESGYYFVVVIFTGGFIAIRSLLHERKMPVRSFAAILTWLIYFSCFSAYIFSTTFGIKDEENKKIFAIKKSIDKDPITEYLFNEMENDIARTMSLQFTAAQSDENTKPGFVNQLRQDFQNNYFKKYQVDIYIFKNDTLLSSTDNDKSVSRNTFVDAIENNGEFTTTRNLFFINDNSGNYYYLAELPVRKGISEQITAYIKLVPKKFTASSIYPELLIDDDLKPEENNQNYNYAVYTNHNLTERQGEYSYPIMDLFYVPKGQEFLHIKENGYDHLVYSINDSKKVVVSEKEKSWFEPISLFSYLFFFFLVFIVLLLLINFIVRIINGKVDFKEWLNTTLQNKIQTAVISLIVFAFIMMGVATIFYISDQYNISHKQKLLTKIQSVQTNIDYLLNENKKVVAVNGTASQIKRIANHISDLSLIHDMDINIYKPNGDLITSSQPDIFNKGLISTKMNPLAYFKMSCDKETWYIQTENIGRLDYLSAYVPIMDDNNEIMFYLNLPYFATEQNLKADISNFMVTLVNVYVLLLVIAGLIAYFVSRSITRPLAEIAGTFKNIKLGKTNEPINWKNEDEIGLLVAEYNKMLKELEKSASMLAKSERESAWRDMAKQVAHEIKNPLTPMRLSIQHLQRAIQTNAPNVKELTKKVTETMLEQIDNLSHIASEFSNFAVMPKAVNEDLCLNDVLENVTDLFRENEQAELNLELPEKEIHIYADKNQILRVFNNLIKNAIQAIPGEKEGVIEITLQQSGQRALIKVKDNGTGIPDEQKEKVFVPNFTTKSSGMGIGLAMSKNIIESAGGFIWFESEAEKGTTFYVEFPLI